MFFEATGGGPPALARIDYVWALQSFHGLTVGDVTGDGVLDAVACAPKADGPGALTDTGAIFVWAGSTTPSGVPTAVLRATGVLTGDVVAYLMLRLADVDGDGVLDVFAPSQLATVNGQSGAGAIYVWAGGPALAGAPSQTATLVGPAPEAGERIGVMVEIADVTGDGLADVVTVSNSDVGAVNAGAAYVWAGAADFTGTRAPSAALRVPGAVADDSFDHSFVLADATGDGQLDVIRVAPRADVGGVVDAGALYVWTGGSSLSGAVSPIATLRVPGATTNDRLGGFVFGSLHPTVQSITFVDLDGDTSLDVVVPAPNADDGTSVDAGALHVFRGGAALTGTVAPWSSLKVSTIGLTGPIGADHLLGELTGDAVLDLIAMDGSNVFVWDGAALAGSPAPLAILSGIARSSASLVAPIQVGDVNDDGVDDVVASADLDSSVVSANGAILVWLGGATLTGTPAADLTLANPSAVASDQMQAHFLTDVTGDGVLDLIGSTQFADVGGFTNAGATYVWFGGASLTAGAPDATLTEPTPATNNAFGRILYTTDVTGDDVQDIVSVCWNADPGGVSDAGAVYVWSGATLGTAPAPIQPTATLVASAPIASDRLGLVDFSPGTPAVLFGHVNGDGATDLVVAASYADVGAAADAGRVYVFTGGAGLTGTVPPSATLTAPIPGAGDRLPRSAVAPVAYSQPFFLADVTADGALDAIVLSTRADVAGVTDAGAIFLWRGGASLTGMPTPTEWTIPGALADDRLGEVTN